MPVFTIKIKNNMMIPYRIQYEDRVLSEYNEENFSIDFSVLYPFVRKKIKLKYINEDGSEEISYRFLNNIEKVDGLGLVLKLESIEGE